MKVDIGNITLYFDPECPECKGYNDYALSGCNVYDLTNTDTPICIECGTDLDLITECDVELN